MQAWEQTDFHPLFSEINPLFASTRETPNNCHGRFRMQGEVDPEILRHAAARTMARYPYFCVRLEKRGNVWGFVSNPLPVVVSGAPGEAVLNAESANYHLLSFGCRGDMLFITISHCLTDGTGFLALARTLLYYYCTERYGAVISPEGIRLEGDEISAEEWEDPAIRITKEPPEDGGEGEPGLNPMVESGLENDTQKTVFSTSIDEKEFMRFNIENDGSPATMTALLLSRAIASVHPGCEKPIRISLCVNQRKALHAPLAHQSLVGGAWLEYKPRMRSLPLDRQATMYRGMVMVQTREEGVLEGLTYINRNARRLMAMDSDEERMLGARKNSDSLKRVLTATVSYTGRSNLGGAESYVRDFHVWANAMNENILYEISAINGRFIIDCSQNFSSPLYWNRFLLELEENGIACGSTSAEPLVIPKISLPWIE